MNKYKKIGLSALAGSLVAMSASAEVSLSGGASVTFTSTHDSDKTGYGMADSVTATYSGETDGGLTITTSLELDGGANASSSFDSRSIKIASDDRYYGLKNAFTHKAGLHVEALNKDPRSYEAFAPELVNRKRKIVIDKFTGVSVLDNKYQQLGFILSKMELNKILKKVKSHVKKASWSNEDLIYLIKSMGIKT